MNRGNLEALHYAASEAASLRLATLLATAVDGIVTIDALGTILTVNEATERLFGYPADEMVGHNVKMLMPEPYHSAHDGYLAHYRETGQRRIIGIGREVVGRRKDGSTFPMDLAVGEARLEEGRFFTGIIRDITERKRAESELRAANRTIESIIAALPVAVVVLGHTGLVRTWNPAALSILGWTSEEAVGQALPETLFVDDPTNWTARLRQTEAIRGEEARCRRKDGRVIDIWLSSAPLRDDAGDLIGVICVMDDITQRKSLANQLHQAQKMEAVGHLTGGLAHDFNNILGVAIGNLDLLSEELEQDPERLELVEAAQKSLLKGADLTRQLLAFARRQPLQPERVQIENVISASIRMLRRTIGEQVEVRLRIDGQIWPVVVDVAQVEAAITNLAINARDAMPDGGSLGIVLANVSLDEDYAALAPEIQAGDYVMIEISDSGHGMRPEILAHAFEPFFTTKPPGKGTGLGLSMVYGFIKQSGGHIRIYSEAGHGTTVKLYLPRATGEEKTPAEQPPAEPMRGGTETILVVEDNADVRRIVMRQLRSLGYRLIEAEDALAALAALRSDAGIDLLFTDVVMPHGMSGFDLGTEAKRLRPGIRVLFTSGFPGTSFPPDIAGGIPLLSKPYRKQELARAIRNALETGSPQR